MKPTSRSAISKINKAGALLVFPLKSNPQFPSLWGSLYPGAKMKWDWSETGDDRVAALWHLRTKLSTSRKVVYLKWFKGRSTLFSLQFFTAMLSLVSNKDLNGLCLSPDAQIILKILGEDSPLATKELKYLCELSGRENNSRFEQAMKQLWQRCLIVGHGEAEEGGYPSLSVCSSRLLFEDAWDSSRSISRSDRHEVFNRCFLPQSDFYSHYRKLDKALMQSA